MVRPILLGRYRVRGHSMEPTLRAGDRVLVSRAALALRRPTRGDVVALRHPRRPQQVLLKRLVGLPGDRYRLEGEGVLRVTTAREGPRGDPGDLQELRADEYLVLGDRADHSEDSRHFGPIRAEGLLGRAWWRYWPAERAGPLPQEGTRKRLKTTGP